MTRAPKGLFISLEGPDGCGKTTQARAVQKELAQQGVKSILTREPGGTPLGEAIREMLLSPSSCGMSPRTEMLLYAASRAQHVDEVVRPHLEAGVSVICDRFIDSSLVYQGVGLALGMDQVLEVNLVATGGLLPDLTIVLYQSASKARERLNMKLSKTKTTTDRIESRDFVYQERVAEGYLRLAELFPRRVVLLNADDSVEEITRGIMSKVHQLERGDRQ
ncbi:MAG: dTMP kinase [Firmicutes bacterium]|nr:dTMP kinase [Dethiobacter sp.]MBS3889162.1 dTMP kinase [Bacillota bacterium]MBS4054717.1 dTMP kinase [Thermaerobacter sp.]